ERGGTCVRGDLAGVLRVLGNDADSVRVHACHAQVVDGPLGFHAVPEDAGYRPSIHLVGYGVLAPAIATNLDDGLRGLRDALQRSAGKPLVASRYGDVPE